MKHMNSFDVAGFQHQRRSSFGSELYYYGEIDSTNRVAEKLCQQSFREGTAVIADSQTEGRGRGTNQWFSPSGENLYFTLLLKPHPSYLHRIPFIAGLAIARALNELELKIDLKWPNDVVIADRKIGGILVQSAMEADVMKYAVVGFGINVNTKSFPSNLKDTATSILMELGKAVNRESILAAVLMNFERLYSEMMEASWEDFCRELEKNSTFIKDCEIKVQNHEGVTEGITAGLDAFGGLIVNTIKGARVFYSGEVQACRKK